MRSKAFRNSRGFTLVEVLVALVIVVVTIPVLVQAVYNSLLAIDGLEIEADEMDDLRFIRNIIIQEPDLETFEEGGEIETLDRGEARWEAEVEPTETLDLFKVTLMIELEGTEKSPDPTTHIETLYLLRPTWSESADRTEILEDLRQRIDDDRRNIDW